MTNFRLIIDMIQWYPLFNEVFETFQNDEDSVTRKYWFKNEMKIVSLWKTRPKKETNVCDINIKCHVFKDFDDIDHFTEKVEKQVITEAFFSDAFGEPHRSSHKSTNDADHTLRSGASRVCSECCYVDANQSIIDLSRLKSHDPTQWRPYLKFRLEILYYKSAMIFKLGS